MKNGSQQTASKPVISARPPMRSSAAILEDLEKVTAITEAPSRAAAEALGQVEEGAAPVAQSEPEASKPAKAKSKAKPPMPWDELEGAKMTQQMNFKLPVTLVAKLKFLGETTYGENMTSLLKKALEEFTDKMLKERGLS